MKLYGIGREHTRFWTEKLFYMAVVIVIMFMVAAYQFYDIQIINHETYSKDVIANVQKDVEIEAPRGIIYDRYGKPLVENKGVYVLQFDPQVKFAKGTDANHILLKVADLLETDGKEYIDNIPISKEPPFIFTGDEREVKAFITNYVPYDDNEQREELCKLSAEELMDYLCGDKVYHLDDTFSDIEKRKILAMRLQISQTSFEKFKKVTIAEDVGMKVIAAIEENQDDYPAITANVEAQRYYTYGKELGNIIGYMRKMTESQYETLKAQGYEQDDVIGQVGIEGEMENTLRGIKGNQLIEVDNVGRTVKPLETKEAVPGNDVYLTIDADLQVAVYKALEKRLSEGIIDRLQGASKTIPLSGRDILVSMAKNNQLDFKEMSGAPQSSAQRQLYEKVKNAYEIEKQRLEVQEKNLPEDKKTSLSIQQHFANMLDSEQESITNQELLLAFGEQGSLPFSKEEMDRIRAGNYSLVSLIIDALSTGKLKPDQMDVTPCSGTVVMVDSNNGQTLAMVGYPSYDSNDFTQDFNEIYTKLHDGVDTRSIEFNRALKTVKAPGSTFKMITGIAALEEGVVGVNEMIYDSGQFTKAGEPPLRCWIYTNTGHGHGDRNMESALEVSCNYYFNELIYRLGEKFGAPYGGIKKLTEYAEMFGLGQKSGIELEEASPNISNPTNAVTTQGMLVLSRLKGMDEEGKEELEKALREYLTDNLGFYTLGDSEDKTIEGQIDYLSHSFIKPNIDTELGLALSDGDQLHTIISRLTEDFNSQLSGKISSIAKELSDTVMAGDNRLSLEHRLKMALNPYLKSLVQEKTIKAIRKMLSTMPDGVMEQAFLEGYKATLDEYQGQSGKEEVCRTLKQHISELEKGTFDCKAVMTNKILDRIINVYLENYFENIEMEWTTRDNISSAIGQGQNTYAPVQMARYIQGIANGKTVYNLTILSGIYDHKEKNAYIPHEPTVFNELKLKEGTIEAIHEGMRAVVVGSSGTARKYFAEFPIEVAAKTGTAEGARIKNYKDKKVEDSFIATFAPYSKPEIAVVSSMYGTNGLGSCTYNVVKDAYSIYFKLEEETEKTSLDNQLVD